VRLFFAITLPGEVQWALSELRPRDESRDYRWVHPSLMHLTLAFLGEQPEERLELLQRVGSEAAQASAPGTLRLANAGSFGSRSAPRVLWVDLVGDVAALNTLQRNLDSSLRAAGFTLEDRPFRAHITLARRRESAQGGPPAGWPPPINAPPAFRLEKLTLMQSRLSPRGATYTHVFQFPIGSAG
jgi:RNA 2',3'-cyclic 3'-phosphodiesterase